jgi:hypothetical protein
MRERAWACGLAMAVLGVGTVSCPKREVPSLSPTKPPGPPIFAGNLTSGGRLLKFEKAKYPRELRHLGYQEVHLRCRVLEDGTVTGITYEGGPMLLFPAARAAVERWRYEPLRVYDPFTGKSNAITFINWVSVPFYGASP